MNSKEFRFYKEFVGRVLEGDSNTDFPDYNAELDDGVQYEASFEDKCYVRQINFGFNENRICEAQLWLNLIRTFLIFLKQNS